MKLSAPQRRLLGWILVTAAGGGWTRLGQASELATAKSLVRKKFVELSKADAWFDRHVRLTHDALCWIGAYLHEER